MKKCTKVLLHFGLDCGMLEFFTHNRNPKNNGCLSAFLDNGLAEKIAA
jgi:hypothetical protein